MPLRCCAIAPRPVDSRSSFGWDATPPFRCRVQLFDEDWEDDDDLLGTSKDTQLTGNGTNSVNFLRLSPSGATVNFSYRWVDADSGPVVLA